MKIKRDFSLGRRPQSCVVCRREFWNDRAFVSHISPRRGYWPHR